jgi:mono/diheme cytochrome c family protein
MYGGRLPDSAAAVDRVKCAEYGRSDVQRVQCLEGWMRRRLALPGCAALVLLGLACGSNISQYEPYSDNGAIIYHEACARCHDDAFDAPLLLRSEVRNLSREKIVDALANGRAGMPSFPLIEGEYLDGLVEFVLQRQAESGP